MKVGQAVLATIQTIHRDSVNCLGGGGGGGAMDILILIDAHQLHAAMQQARLLSKARMWASSRLFL